MTAPPAVFWDTETFRFVPGRQAPQVVCLQYCDRESVPALQHRREVMFYGQHVVPLRRTLDELMWSWLRDDGAVLVGQNVAYDFACMASDYPDLIPEIYRAYREGRVRDTKYRQYLADIGRGRFRTRRYDLGSLSEIHGGPTLDKDDPWRERYGELDAVPLVDWPAEAVRYALLDAEATRAVYLSQEARYHPQLLCRESEVVAKMWALQLASVWGFRTSARGVKSLREGAEQERERLLSTLVEAGLVRPDGSRDTKAAKARVLEVAAELGATPKVTAGGDVSLSSDALAEYGDSILDDYVSFASYTKVLTTDVEMLTKGLVLPVHPHYELVESERTSTSKPNSQNFRRLFGVRECFVPRGFDESAYDSMELTARDRWVDEREGE